MYRFSFSRNLTNVKTVKQEVLHQYSPYWNRSVSNIPVHQSMFSTLVQDLHDTTGTMSLYL